MDFNSLKDQVSGLSLYDIKAGVRKVQNAVMNYTEMEAKVREATNNEPWGASSTLMQEIASGTFNYQLLNEIMPMIYKRFTEKSAEEWRQIYKALQLLEFLIKNGSERVIDDARSHVSLLRMLRQFHFIDQNGKDQGVNVRNRAKELAEMLGDVDRIRAERKKAKQTRNKYGGIEGGMGLGSGMSGGSRYGGFGSEEAGYGGYSGGVYGDGGGFGGQSGGFDDAPSSSNRRERFEEYDEYDEGAVAAAGRRQENTTRAGREKSTKKPAPPPKEPEVDLFDFGDDDNTPSQKAAGKQPAATPASSGLGGLAAGGSGTTAAAADDDDFDDFQSAGPIPAPAAAPSIPKPNYSSLSTPAVAPQIAAPQPVSGSKGSDMNDLVGFASISPAPGTTRAPSGASAFAPLTSPTQPKPQGPQPTGYQSGQPNYFTSVQAPASQSSTPVSSSAFGQKPAAPAAKPSSGGDAFGSIWNSASTGIKKSSTPTQGPNLASMAKQQASSGLWGATPTAQVQAQQPAAQPQTGTNQKLGGGLDDLLG